MFFMVILGICYLSHHPAAESLGLSNVINTSLYTVTPILLLYIVAGILPGLPSDVMGVSAPIHYT